MTEADLARVVLEMRNAQKEFHRTQSQSAHDYAEKMEQKVDRCLRHILTHPPLFDQE